MTLRPLLQKADIHLTGNAHIDAAWLWPWTETVEVVRQTFGTALQLMNEYPKYTYTQSAAAYDEWMEQKYPAEFNQIKQRVNEGRWEMVGGMWVEPDLNMPDGESQVRQLLIGKRYFQSRFGVDVRIGWNPDSFGYNWQLPQIYKRSGVDYFVTQKMAWNDTNPLPLKLFWWQSPDGSRVLTYFPHDYGNEIEPINMAKAFAHAREHNPGTTEMMHLYGVGDHGGGPTRAMLDAGDRWLSPDKAYARLTFRRCRELFFRGGKAARHGARASLELPDPGRRRHQAATTALRACGVSRSGTMSSILSTTAEYSPARQTINGTCARAKKKC